jgi:uncharacterized membrane protein
MQTDTDNRSFLDYLILALKGFCMGASDVVPGVSGGTMAFILGIYEELINAIKSFDLKSVQLLATLKIRMPFLPLPGFLTGSFRTSLSWSGHFFWD